jgi:ribosomal protein S19E (S16A)
LSRFARAVLAPVAASRCEWCSGGGCPACGADTGRERYALVLRAVQEDGPISGREVRRRLGGAPGLIVRALTALEREGLVAREGSGRMTTWRARSLEDES